MSDRSKNIERQMKNSEFRAEHEASKTELEKLRKAYQELQYTDNEKHDLQYRVDMAKALFGILPSDVTLEEARMERLSENDAPICIH